MTTPIDLAAYTPTDDFFGAPFIDEDVHWDAPLPHRMIHGGFSGADTRFRFHFPDEGYQGRMFNPLSGANGGTEDFFHSALGDSVGGVTSCFRLGGYMVQSNQGHIGDVLDPKAGEDPTIYGWRASAEVARLSKYVATQIYGAPPHHSYVFGGSGGARRSPLCLAYAPDAWDAAMPFVGDAMDGDYGDFSSPRNGAGHFATMFNVQRVLGDKLDEVIDAMRPGGSRDPFRGLDTHQADELAALYRLGYPRGDEFMIANPVGQIWLWASTAERFERDDVYFQKFWTEPGHIGHDQPELLAGALLQTRGKVSRVLTAQDIVDDPAFAAPEHAAFLNMVLVMAQGMGMGMTLPCAIEIKDLGPGYRLGANVTIATGAGAGRKLVCVNASGDFFACDGMGEASNRRFSGLQVGDEVEVSNRAFLAYCYYARHHLGPGREYDIWRVGGRALYPQYEMPSMSPLMGTPHTGKFPGKMIWVHHTHDASLWPSQGLGMKNNVAREVGEAEGRKHFRLRWTQNAEHGPAAGVPDAPGRASNTWLIDYLPVLEQTLSDLVDWVERDVEPAETHFDYRDGELILPLEAAERGGIQPVIAVTANGGERAEVNVGETVRLQARVQVPPGAGGVISLRWDFDGSGTYPETATADGRVQDLTATTEHRFDRPGVYFVTALAESHRDGDVHAASRRIPNLASARVIVR